MDEMAQGVENLVVIAVWTLSLTGAVLFFVAMWVAYFRCRRKELRRALWTLILLVILSSALSGASIALNADYLEDPWKWFLVFAGLPLTLGYAFGAMLGLIRTPDA
ncbi:MAG: hypothetical protein R3D60_08925 [Paracoccaceae bacterium]